MIKFIEIMQSALRSTDYVLNEVWINQSHVIKIQSSLEFKRLLSEGRLPSDLDQNHEFTSIGINMGGIMERQGVVGNTASVAALLNHETRTLLKG
jgi:hypothetical protein